MAALINVNGSDDPSYRYKMPRLVGKIEGRGNGIKTVIVNCSEVASSLKRSPGQVTKFFGCELGAMTKYEEKIDRSLVNGAFETKDLQEILTKYIAKFVLCPSCGNPETDMEIKGKKKSATIWLSCKACGAIEEADNTHKLCTFILKEMGPEKGKTKKEDRKKKKAEKQAALERGETLSAEGDSNSGDAESDKKKKKKKEKKKKDRDSESDKERKRKKKEKKRREREREGKMSESFADEAHPEDNESESSSDSDFEAPVASLSNMTIHDAAALDSGAASLAAFIQRNPTLKELADETQTVQVNCGLRASDRIPLLFFAIVGSQLAEGVAKWFPAIKGFISTRTDQEEVLKCLEESVMRAEPGVKQVAAKKMVPLILKFLYDGDILDEETIFDWHAGNVVLKHNRIMVPSEVVVEVKNNAAPIVQWLKEAESDESEDED